MIYKKFFIENYRGINKVEIDFRNNRILTLVGLNESGKTTILEGIHWVYKCLKKEYPGKEDLNYFRPKGISFTGDIILKTTLLLEEWDKVEIKRYWKEILKKKKRLEIPDEISFEIAFHYLQHSYKEKKERIEFPIKTLGAKRELKDVRYADWENIISFVRQKLVPEIIFYEDFLFDIPKEIVYPLSLQAEQTHSSFITNPLNLQWQSVLDDILRHVKKEFTSFKEFVIDIWGKDEETARQRINAMQRVINSKISESWKSLFKEKRPHFKEIKLIPTPRNGILSISFKITSEEGVDFSVDDRSKGFKWFFAFLIFTEFRKKRSRNILFLLDEPASNLHSSAQEKILEAIFELSKESLVIYSTHSPYLINPKWLSGAYVVINEVITEKRLKGELTFEEGGSITIEPYFRYIGKGKGNVNFSYFQPILDKLEYKPSFLDPVPEIVITEGRDDWFTFKYFSEVIFQNKFNFKFYAGAGKDQLWEIIRLYLSWGSKFIVILDGDKGGERAKENYLREFECFIKDKIFTLKDIFQKNLETEDLIGERDKRKIIDEVCGKGTYESIKTKKSSLKQKLNLSIRHLLSENKKINMHKNTMNLFEKLFNFIQKKLRQ